MMPKVDPQDSEQNAFVQLWLAEWVKSYPGDTTPVYEVIEVVQETYDHTDHMARMSS